MFLNTPPILRKQRDSNLELYRIVVMLLIVAHHYVVNSGVLESINANLWSAKSLFYLLFGAWGKTGINCFVLITGYYMCQSRVTFQKFLKLFLEVMFYNLLIGGIFLATGYLPITFKNIVDILLPFRDVSGNFTTCYLIFFFFIPFLTKLVHALNEKEHRRLIGLCAFVYVFYETVPYCRVTHNYVSWFVILFFIGSYLRLYPKKYYENTRLWCCLTIVLLLSSAASVVVCSWTSVKLGHMNPYYLVVDSNNLLPTCLGVASFLFFRSLKLDYHPLVNFVGATTFGVLLIHANSNAMRQWLWRDLLDVSGHYGVAWFWFHAVASVIGIFIICSMIDLLRIHFIERSFFKWRIVKRLGLKCPSIILNIILSL